MSVHAKPQIRCASCKVPLQKNYDHVGDCSRQACAGTFAHPTDRHATTEASRHCIWRDRDLRHHQTVTE